MMVVTRVDIPKYGETLKIVYIKYQPILAKFTKCVVYLLVHVSRSVSPYFGVSILAITNL